MHKQNETLSSKLNKLTHTHTDTLKHTLTYTQRQTQMFGKQQLQQQKGFLIEFLYANLDFKSYKRQYFAA